jgi:hypothetical protein
MPANWRYPSVEALPAHWQEQARRQLGMRAREAETAKPQRKSKYGAKRVTVDGIAFDSKRESRRYELLKAMQAAGEIKRFHRQVTFDLEGGVIYICDFQVFHLDDSVVYEDSKGVRTKEFNMKRRMVRARYGVEIILV